MRRRFQRGAFVHEAGGWYGMWYEAAGDGTTKRVKRLIGRCDEMSERAARRTHAIQMEKVNAIRGSLAPLVKGQSFSEATIRWRQAVSPNLSPATVRAMESHLRVHVLPKFKDASLQEIDLGALQQFATDLRNKLSRHSVIHVLTTMQSIINYAAKCKTPVNKVSIKDLELGRALKPEVPFFTKTQYIQIIELAKEPFKTLFVLAWNSGLRAGELLALTVDDLNFVAKTIRVNKSADDNTREIRQPKTEGSVATLPMSSTLAALLQNYLRDQWRSNPAGILFPTKAGIRPRSRDNVVKVGLHPVLRSLGIPTKDVGLHAFRHGLATALVQANAPISTLQSQMRHADVATTLKIYSHVIQQSQRDVMEAIGTKSSIGTKLSA